MKALPSLMSEASWMKMSLILLLACPNTFRGDESTRSLGSNDRAPLAIRPDILRVHKSYGKD